MQPFESQPGTPPPDAGTLAPPPGVSEAIDRALVPAGSQAPATVASDPYKDQKKILEYLKTCKRESLELRWVYDRGSWRLVLYLLGRQWIYYDRKRGWVDKRFARWIPRPVTNKLAENLEVIRSTFAAIDLSTTARPTSQDPKAITTAQTSDDIEPLIKAEHNVPRIWRRFDFWFAGVGNVFLHPWWNPEKRARLSQHERCVGCNQVYPPAALAQQGPMPVCPACRGTAFEPAVDEDNRPIGDVVYRGGGETDVCSPFEIALPPGYEDLDACPYVVRMRWRVKGWVKDHYPETVWKKLVWERSPHERTLQLAKALATQSDITATPISWSAGADSAATEGIAEYEVWARPCRDWPMGLVARALGDATPVLVNSEDENLPGPLPYRTAQGVPLFPWVHAGYEDFGGRIWARSPLDRAIQKQDQLNQLDSFTELCVNRMANPVWLEPRGAHVKHFTGEPGLVLKYDPLAVAGNAKPERLAGQNLSPGLVLRRQSIIKDIEDAIGTSDPLRGQKPPGVEAYSALNLLVERSQSRLQTAFNNRAEAYREWYSLALELERQFGPSERVQAVLRPNRSWTFKTFKNADLSGGVEVLIEQGSQTPKTSLGRRAAIEHANQLGILDKNDPEQRFALFQELGITRLAPGLDYAVKSALQEQDAFEKWARGLPPGPVVPAAPVMPPIGAPLGVSGPLAGPVPPLAPPSVPISPLRRLKWHRDDVHLGEHRKWACGDEVRAILAQHQDLEAVIGAHLDEHEQAMALAAMPTAVPPPGPPQGAALAMERSIHESGNPADLPSGHRETAQLAGPR